MCNNIKQKALGVRKLSLLLVFLLIISMFTMAACDSEEVVITQEFELVSCYIEYRNKTNGFGGILRTDEYLHYGYVDDNGQVIFDEIYFDSIDFRITEETSKVIIIAGKGWKDYVFELTREMYNNLNTSQQ